MPMNGSQIISRLLREEGIDTVFTIAGDHTLPLMDQLARDGIRFVDSRHEQAAVDMANAYGRITGRAAVTLFTTPGHANAISGLNFAHHLESPVINIAGCAEQSRLGQGASQEIDQVGMARPVTKGAWLVPTASALPNYFRRAFRTALSGRRGPVHLTIPVDVQTATVNKDVRFLPAASYRQMGALQGDPDRVAAAADLLRSAARAMVVVGNGAYTITREDLEAFTAATGLPVFTEEAARGVIPDSHPHCHGHSDPRANPVARRLANADAVLFLGKKLDATINFGEPPFLAPDVRIVQVEIEAGQIGLARGVDISIHGDVGAVLRQLTAAAADHDWPKSPLHAELAQAWIDEQRQLEARAAATRGGLHTMKVHQALRPLLGADDALVFEGSDFAFYAMPYYPAEKPHRWFTNGTAGMIGWGLPFALGAQVALPDSRVIVLTGDGSFGFNGMELDTAVRLNLPVVVVMGNDAIWGMDYHQQADLYGRTVATELLPTRYDQVATALGAHGEYVETADQLPAALERALGAGRPALVNVRTHGTPSPITEWIMEVKREAARHESSR